MKKSTYEVWITKWDDQYGRQIKTIAGTFDAYVNARLFAQAYADHYHADTEIVEYRQIGIHVISENL